MAECAVIGKTDMGGLKLTNQIQEFKNIMMSVENIVLAGKAFFHVYHCVCVCVCVNRAAVVMSVRWEKLWLTSFQKRTSRL